MQKRRTRRLVFAASAVATVAIGLIAIAGPADAETVTAATTPSAKAATCDRTAWESPVQGTPPTFKAGDRSGDYLWHDTHGFHLRVTHAAHDRRVYTGVITASAPMRYTPVKLEKGDIVKLSNDRRTLSFSFVNYGRIDGADFHTDCAASLTVSRLHVGDADLSAGHVYLGADERHPAHIPFTVHRTA
jgi:hypothetical protein